MADLLLFLDEPDGSASLSLSRVVFETGVSAGAILAVINAPSGWPVVAETTFGGRVAVSGTDLVASEDLTATASGTVRLRATSPDGRDAVIRTFDLKIEISSLPVNTVAPTIDGTALVGQVLTANSGMWTGSPAPTFTYQWYRGTTAISDATSRTYTPVTADRGTSLACEVTATNRAGTAARRSALTSQINAALKIEGAPGTARIGSSFTFQPAVSGGSGTRSFSLNGTLPSGLAFDRSTGTITGTPTVEGRFPDLSIAVTDDTGTVELAFEIFVDESASLLAYPRLALIGPSTVIQNHEAGLGNSNSAYNTQALSSGPVVWALAKDRRAQCLIVTETTGNYIGGDNQAQFGVGFNEYPAQIDAIKTRMADVPVAQRIAYYEFGRNDLSTTTQVDRFKADITRDVNNLKSFGFGKISVAKLWKRHTSVGGEWASGGQARADVEAINAWLDTTYGGDPDVKLIDYASVLTDPASADGNPYAWVCRTDGTHFAPKGAYAAAKALNAVLAPLCRRRTYPAAPAENTIPALAGTGGAKTAVTGEVADGWTAALTVDTTASVVGSIVQRDGKPYQRFTIGNAQNIPATGAQLDFRKTTAVAVPAGAKVGLRYRCIIPANQFPIALFHLLGTGSTIGAATGASSYSIVSPTDASNATPRVTATGTGFQNAGKLPNEELLDLWIETPGFVLGASGGSNVGVSFRTLFGPAPAGQTLQIDIGEIQIFNWPIG